MHSSFWMGSKLAQFLSNLGNVIMAPLKLNIYHIGWDGEWARDSVIASIFPRCIINSFLQLFMKSPTLRNAYLMFQERKQERCYVLKLWVG